MNRRVIYIILGVTLVVIAAFVFMFRGEQTTTSTESRTIILRNIADGSRLHILTSPHLDISYTLSGEKFEYKPLSIITPGTEYALSVSYLDDIGQNLSARSTYSDNTDNTYAEFSETLPLLRGDYTLYSSGPYDYYAWVQSPTATTETVTDDARKVFSNNGINPDTVELDIIAGRAAREDGSQDPIAPVPKR